MFPMQTTKPSRRWAGLVVTCRAALSVKARPLVCALRLSLAVGQAAIAWLMAIASFPTARRPTVAAWRGPAWQWASALRAPPMRGQRRC